MAQTERAKEDKAGALRRKQEEKRARRFTHRASVSMEQLEMDALHYALSRILSVGGALRIGVTRDGGAWAFGIYGDGGEPYTDYLPGGSDVGAYLRELGEFFERLASGEGRD